MSSVKIPDLILLKIGVLLILVAPKAVAQIVPDGTLPNNSLVTPNGNISVIEEGTIKGNNLFHSFEQFSLPTGSGAFFNNALTIQNIFSRVTGASVSNIDGLISANGAANLFLLNPNGIIFGPNALLNIGGSFFGSTANSIHFADGVQFSATNPQSSPLLTVSAPVGLEFGSNSGAILVQGLGHNFIGQQFFPVVRNFNSVGLQVRPGRTLALLGGDVTLNGGILRAPGGQIAIGSVDSGVVNFEPTSGALDYQGVSSFKDVQLFQRSVADASGNGRGSIQVQGRNIKLTDGSVMLIQNQGLFPSGTLSLTASDSLQVSGTDPIARIPGVLRTATFGFGDGGDIFISAPKLKLTEGGGIQTITYGNARAGNITLDVSKSLEIFGVSPRSNRTLSNITSISFGSGGSGNISVETEQFTAKDGGLLLSATAGTGNGGNIEINASDVVELSGVEPNTLAPSAISASTGFSNAGSVTINTSRLLLRDGGRVDSSTFASGSGGNVSINASELVEVQGTVPGSRNPSLIISSANILDEALRQTFELPGVPALTGKSGDVTISTGQLRVLNGASVSVKNEGTGDAGTLQINAPFILLDNAGSLAASTQSGEGGNITITSQDIRLFDSQISATAGGTGNGGNINIDTDTLALLNNSSITANAFEGQGGNINIAGQGFLASLDSLITASSQFGTEGVVQLNIDPFQIISADTGLPVKESSLEDLLTQTCSILSKRRDRFTVRGTGGTANGQVRSYTLEDLAPSGQVFGFIKKSDGTVRLLSCDSLEGIDSEISEGNPQK